MGDLTPLHAQCMRLIIGLRQGLEKLESAEVRLSQLYSGVDCAKDLTDVPVSFVHV